MTNIIKRIGPYSRPNALAKLDGRRREAKLMQQTRSELAAHVGGSPNAVQRRLIERASVLALRLALMDAKAPDGGMSEKDAREYLCWSNSYVRTLASLGAARGDSSPLTSADALRILRDEYGVGRAAE